LKQYTVQDLNALYHKLEDLERRAEVLRGYL